MTLAIHLEIPSQNDTGKGRTWRARAVAIKKVRTLWRSWTRIQMNVEGVPSANCARRMHVIAYRTRKCADVANLIGGAKACIDGMVDAGLLLDDRDSLARITYEQRLASQSPTKKPMTVLLIENIDSSASQLPTT